MLYREIIAVCSQIHTTQMHAPHLHTFNSSAIVTAIVSPDIGGGCRRSAFPLWDVKLGPDLAVNKQGDRSVNCDTQRGMSLTCGRSASTLAMAPRSLPVFSENKLGKYWFITTAFHIYRVGCMVAAWCIHCMGFTWRRSKKLPRMEHDVCFLETGLMTIEARWLQRGDCGYRLDTALVSVWLQRWLVCLRRG